MKIKRCENWYFREDKELELSSIPFDTSSELVLSVLFIYIDGKKFDSFLKKK